MEKSVEATKTVHHVLIAATVAMLFFAATPEKLDTYHRAEAEVSALVAFDPGSYFDYLAEQARPTSEGARRSIEAVGAPLDAIRVPLYCDTPGTTAPLREWEEFVNRRRLDVQAFLLAQSSTSEMLESTRRTIKELDRVDVVFIADSQHMDDYDDFFRRRPQTRCLPLRGVTLSRPVLIVRGHKGAMRPTTSIPIAVDEGSIRNAFFLLWAASHWPHRQMQDGMPLLLADAASIADVYDKTPAQALVAVQDRLDRSKGQLSVIGISLPIELALWAGPLILTLLLASLYSHLKHVQRAAQKAQTDSHPWIALFPDAFSRFLTVLSVSIGPLCAEVLLIYRGAPKTTPSFIGLGALFLLSLGLSIRCVLTIRDLVPVRLAPCKGSKGEPPPR